MLKKLYKKLYFYTLLVLIATIILTATMVDLITRRDFQGKFSDLLDNQVAVVKIELKKIPDNSPKQFDSKIAELEKETSWNISYWKDGKCINNCNQEHLEIQTKNQYKKLLSEKITQVIHRENSGPIVLSYIDKLNPGKGFVIVSLNNFPPPPQRTKSIVLSIIFILGFLSLFLLPYTKYVLRPFKELMKSINNISESNFSVMIPVNQKSDFKEISETFNNMTLKIQEMVNEKQRLVAYISHELKTPLTKIQLAQELLLSEGKGKQKYIEITINEADHLNKLIDELLETSELELNFDKSTMNKVDFKEVIENNVEKNNLLFEKSHIKINMDLSDTPVYLELNQKLMDHALNNIFSNIVKYAPNDSDVDLILKEENNKVVFSIRDYGPGVLPENYEKIFEPFYRTDASRREKIKGTGLGLSLVKKITELHGGKVWADSPSDNKSGLVMTMEI